MTETIALRRDVLLWLGAGALACVLALYHFSATLVAGSYVPGDPDSFYHAHRILDALAAPTRLAQFDPRIHAPEGSWVTWPWAYDMLLACIAHLAVYDFGVHDPMSVLVFVAPAWVFVNAALIAAIAAELELSLPLKAVALLCFALSPLTQNLHRVGMLDHHYVEYSFVLATLLLGLRWFRRVEDRGRAATLGLALGAAPAFHNGLFIVQLPVLLSLAALWLQGRGTPRPATAAFSAALVGGTLLFLLPSEPFRRLMFSFSLQSWFHLYIAASTAGLALTFAWFAKSRRSVLAIAAAVLVLLAIIAQQVIRGGDFLSGRLADLDQIAEVEGIFGYLRDGDFQFLTSTYSGLLWLMPLAVAGLCWRLRAHARAADLFLAVMSVFGLILLLQQYRLENYGSFALYFPLCRLAEDAREHWPRQRWRIVGATAALAAAAYVPAYGALREQVPLGGSLEYEMTRSIYPPLAAACAAHPGVVLADNADGHFITYHTRCAVIADDFIMTAQHERKLLLAQQLMQGSVADVLAQAPYVRYIYVRRNDNVFSSACGLQCPENRGLRAQLLSDQAPPADLRLVYEIRLRTGGSTSLPLARAFEIVEKR